MTKTFFNTQMKRREAVLSPSGVKIEMSKRVVAKEMKKI